MRALNLKQYLQSFMDGDSSPFKAFPQSNEETARDWKESMEKYYKRMVIPIPGVGNPLLLPGLQTFEQGVLAIINSNTFRYQIANQITILHNQICTGVDMQSAGTLVTTRPFVPLNLEPCFIGLATQSATQVCTLFANIIDSWVHTTFSTNTISGIVFNWT